jgi:hypothetical protein
MGFDGLRTSLFMCFKRKFVNITTSKDFDAKITTIANNTKKIYQNGRE